MPTPSTPDPVRKDPLAAAGSATPSAFASLRILFLVLIFLLVVVQALSLGPLNTRFWGFHLWGQVSAPAAGTAILLWIAAWVTIFRARGARIPEDRRSLPGRVWPATLGVSLAAGAIFWFLRTGHTLLGDGYPISITLAEGELSPRLPLTKLIQVWWLDFTRPLFTHDGSSPETVVRQSVALLHVICGVLFVPVALALGRILVRRSGGEEDRGSGWLAGAILLTQGFMLLFFGYVEHYSLVALAVAVFLWTSLLYLEKRVPLVLPLLVLIAAVGLHLTAALLIPSAVLLVVLGLRRGDRWTFVLRDCAGAVLGVVLLNWFLGSVFPGYGLKEGFANLVHTANKDHGGGSGVGYMVSVDHGIDFLNEHFLIGPLAALFLLPVMGIWLVRRGPRTPAAMFLTLAALSALAASWVAAEPTLGYARDWDVFAPLASVYTAAVLALILVLARARTERTSLLLAGLLVSCAHLGCWVLLNHSEPRSLARLGSLTGQKGRNHVTVGNWYLQRNDPKTAEGWFRRALAENPGNNDAMNLLGVALAREGNPGDAARSLEQAVRLRPNKPEYREDLVRALLEVHRYEDALPHLEYLREHRPWNPENWIHRAMVLSALGRGREAEAVLEEATAFFEPALDRLPREDHDTLVALGYLFSARGRFDTALELFRRALVLRPDSEAALLRSVAILGEAGRYAEARPLAERFVRRYPEDPESARLIEWMDQLPE